MSRASSNLNKHTSSNPLQQYFIGQFYSQLLSMLSATPGRSLLDAGCGEGFTLGRITATWPGKYQLEGIDISPAAIEAGRKLNPSLTLQTGSAYNLPYPDNSFDIVLCNEVLEHLEDPSAALQELHRVAKNHVILSVPREPLFRLANFLRGKNLTRWGNDIEHIQHWSASSFKKYIQANHFQPIAIRQPFPWTIIAAKVI